MAGFLGCAYFAWISFGHVSRNEYEWPHDAWTAATYVVWILLLAGLAGGVTTCLTAPLLHEKLTGRPAIDGVAESAQRDA